MTRHRYAITSFLLLLISAGSSFGDTVHVWWYQEGVLTSVPRESAAPDLDSALALLTAGPTAAEIEAGFISFVPPGTACSVLASTDESPTIDFTKQVLAYGMSEERLEGIYRQVSWTARPYRSVADLRLTCGGTPLSEFLPAYPVIGPVQPPQVENGAAPAGALAGRSITMSPGHGHFWNGSGWYFQRPVYCSPLNNEDLHNLEICQYLQTYLAADGMLVKPVRCMDMTYGNHAATGKPWWQMAGYLWLQHIGYPCSVYASSTGDCETGAGTATEHPDEVASRPLASNMDGTDIYISMHTNGLRGDCTGAACPTGTEVYYDAGSQHAEWGAASQSLANEVSDSLMSAVISGADATWTCTNACVKNSNGAYGEIRIPHRPAILVELGYHDTCDRDADANHLRDNFFRSAMMWGVYRGVCNYFGTSPTWDFYSCEYVSDTLPFAMQPGETRNVSITYRNRGVLWKKARGFALGAVGDSDPFTASSRVHLAAEVGPGAGVTFNFTLTAPTTPGYYTTDWQMVRDGYTWFGPAVSRRIQVGSPPTDLIVEDFETYPDLAAFQAVWSPSWASMYTLEPTPERTGKALFMPSPPANGTGIYYRNFGRTYLGTDAEPLVLEYDLYLDPADAVPWAGARHSCGLQGYQGGAFQTGFMLNVAAIGVSNASTDAHSDNHYQGRLRSDAFRWYTLDGAGAPVRSAGWRRMKVVIKTGTIDFHVDGALAESFSRITPAGFDCVVLGTGLFANGHRAYVDNVEVYLDSQPPMITQQPGHVAGCPGATAVLSVQAIGQALEYRWQRDGADLQDSDKYSGTGTASLSIAAFSGEDLGEYRCVVANAAGTVTSDPAGLTVRELPLFTADPQPAAAAMGAGASFNVAVASPDPVTYSWRRNGVALLPTARIKGVDEPTVTITDVRADNVGIYTCAITGPCGTLVSAGAGLSLTTVPGDFDGDSDVDMKDFGFLQTCLTGVSGVITIPSCNNARLDQDTDVDITDVEYFQRCLTGTGVPGTPACVE